MKILKSEGLLLLVWEVQGLSGGWDECFREGEETQLHLFKTCNWLMWQKLTRSPVSLSLLLCLSPSLLMMTVIWGESDVSSVSATIPGSLRPPSWSSDRHHPDHQSLISIAAIILASTPLRTWGYMVVRGNQNNPLFAQSLNWEYWCWMSSDIFLYLLCSPVRVTPCHDHWGEDYDGSGGGDTGGGGWWELTRPDHN